MLLTYAQNNEIAPSALIARACPICKYAVGLFMGSRLLPWATLPQSIFKIRSLHHSCQQALTASASNVKMHASDALAPICIISSTVQL